MATMDIKRAAGHAISYRAAGAFAFEGVFSHGARQRPGFLSEPRVTLPGQNANRIASPLAASQGMAVVRPRTARAAIMCSRQVMYNVEATTMAAPSRVLVSGTSLNRK